MARSLVCDGGVMQTGCVDGAGLHRRSLYSCGATVTLEYHVVKQEQAVGPI